jgi:hypothetical protein
MQAAILLVLVAGASAFLKQEAQKTEQDAALSSWEQIQEDALARTGDELPRTVIRVAEAKPKASAFLEVEASADAAQEITLKAQECMACVDEHLDGEYKYSMLTEDRAEQVCSFCALYAVGGIYAGKDVEVNPKAWSALPKNKITLIEDNSLLASPARMPFWKEAAQEAAKGEFSLSDAIKTANNFNVLQCAKGLNEEKCTVQTESFGSPMVLLEVQNKGMLAQKYNKMHSGIASLMGIAQQQLAQSIEDLEEAEKSGDAAMIAIAKESIQFQEGMNKQVLSEEQDLKERMDGKVTAGALLEEQSVEEIVKSESGLIQETVQYAIDQLKNNDGTDQGEALLTAAKAALSPANLQSLEISQVQATKLDAQLREAVQNLQNADTMGTMAAAEAQKQVEESVSEVMKTVMKNKENKAQFRQLVKRLSKFLPAEKQPEKVNLLSKSPAKNATATKPKTKEQQDKDAMKALLNAIDHPMETMKKGPASLLEKAGSEKALEELVTQVEDLIHSEESQSMAFPFNAMPPQAMMESAAAAAEAATQNEIENSQ